MKRIVNVKPKFTQLQSRSMRDTESAFSIHDLRSYLELLEQHGQLMRVKKPVSIIHEAADVGATCERTGGHAPLFESMEGFEGWRLFSSAVANQECVATALNCEKSCITATMARIELKSVY